MGIVAWIVFGLIAGFLAKMLMPGKETAPAAFTMSLPRIGNVM